WRGVSSIAPRRFDVTSVATIQCTKVARQMLQLCPWRGAEESGKHQRVAFIAELGGETAMRGRSRAKPLRQREMLVSNRAQLPPRAFGDSRQPRTRSFHLLAPASF